MVSRSRARVVVVRSDRGTIRHDMRRLGFSMRGWTDRIWDVTNVMSYVEMQWLDGAMVQGASVKEISLAVQVTIDDARMLRLWWLSEQE